jgi:hypothetical protein
VYVGGDLNVTGVYHGNGSGLTNVPYAGSAGTATYANTAGGIGTLDTPIKIINMGTYETTSGLTFVQTEWWYRDWTNTDHYRPVTYNNYLPALSIFSDNGNTYLFAVTQRRGDVYARGFYGNVSDSNLKENIVKARDYTEDLCKIDVVNFNFKDPSFTPIILSVTEEIDIKDTSGNIITSSTITKTISTSITKQLGFVAQQVKEVFPTLTEMSYATNEETSETTSTMILKTSVLTPMMLTAIQHFKPRIDLLESSLSTLQTLYNTRMSSMESTINGLLYK